MPIQSLRRGDGRGQYLAFLGRGSPEKGLDEAIEIARRSGMRLRIAAKVDPADVSYFEKGKRFQWDKQGKENQNMSKPSILAGRIALAACITLLPLAVGAQTDSMSKSAYGSQGQMSKVSAIDKKFVKQASEGGIAEVEL